jgi:hypothetical protein
MHDRGSKRQHQARRARVGTHHPATKHREELQFTTAEGAASVPAASAVMSAVAGAAAGRRLEKSATCTASWISAPGKVAAQAL